MSLSKFQNTAMGTDLRRISDQRYYVLAGDFLFVVWGGGGGSRGRKTGEKVQIGRACLARNNELSRHEGEFQDSDKPCSSYIKRVQAVHRGVNPRENRRIKNTSRLKRKEKINAYRKVQRRNQALN